MGFADEVLEGCRSSCAVEEPQEGLCGRGCSFADRTDYDLEQSAMSMAKATAQ
jgi:hypothetical protein